MQISSSTASDVENGLKRVSRGVINEYAYFCLGDEGKQDELDRLYWAMIKADIELEDRRKNVERTAERRVSQVEAFRLAMRTISMEIRGLSKNSQLLFEQLDARLIERLAEENEQLRRKLSDAGLPKDWRDAIAPKRTFEQDEFSEPT